MTTIQLILEQLKITLKTATQGKAFHQALVEIDFKLIDLRSGLMRICFSPLANWFLFLSLACVYLNPFKFLLSLNQLAGFQQFSMEYLFGQNLDLIFVFFVALNIAFRKLHIVFLALLAFLISNGDIHLLTAIVGFYGLLCGALVSFVLSYRKLKGEVLQIVVWTFLFKILSVIGSYFIVLWSYLWLTMNGFFSVSLSANRLEFLILSIGLHLAVELGVFSLWGHFYAQKKIEPTEWRPRYSTALFLDHYKISDQIKTALLARIKAGLEVKNESLVGIPVKLIQLNEQQQIYLELARQKLLK